MPLAGPVEPQSRCGTPTLEVAFGGAWAGCVDEASADEADVVLALMFEVGAWLPWLDEAMQLLSPVEREKVERKRRPTDRDELGLAYALHRLAVASFLRCDPAAVELERDALGRPFVQGHDLPTSLSHGGGAVAVALGRRGFVGIDIEPASRAGEMPGIAASVMHGAEVDVLSALPDVCFAQALLELWVRKEALLKASGIGLIREMDSFEAPLDQPVGLPAADGTEGVPANLAMLETGPRWVAAIAGLPAARVHASWLFPFDRLAGSSS